MGKSLENKICDICKIKKKRRRNNQAQKMYKTWLGLLCGKCFNKEILGNKKKMTASNH